VGFHGRRVEKNLVRRAVGLRERLKQTDPHALGCPTHIAIVEGFPRTLFARRVDPAAARLQNVNDAADDATIVDPRLAARVSREMRFDL
jgi:hypothetical protein